MTNSVSKSATKKTAPTKAASKVAVKKVPTKTPATKAVVKKAVVAKTPAKAATKKVAKKAPTTILAKVDVGFGNELFLRGSGSGLSWEKGALMSCLPDGSAWVLVLESVASPISVKFVLNDSVWAQGEDLEIVPGSENVSVPIF